MTASARRTRLLFVISQLIQGGAERWLYEVARGLDRARFEVEVLTSPLVRGPRHVYLEPLREAGIPVHGDLPLVQPLLVKAGLRSGRMEAAYRSLGLAARARLGRRWFRGFDLVCPVQIENWYAVRGCVEPERTIIHLMSNAVQHDHDHLCLLRDGRRYRLVLFNEAQRAELNGIDHEAFLWPLAMDLANRPRLALPEGSRRIGVFTRLSRQKPLEPLLYAFHTLRAEVPEAELHVFGAGDPGVFGHTIDLLHLRDAVRFRGHAPDLDATLRDERIALCWMLSVDDAVGYASIEAGSLGVPLLFWNLGTRSHDEVGQATGGAVQAFRSVAALAETTARLLADRRLLERHGRLLREHVLRRHHLAHTIEALERHYERTVRGPAAAADVARMPRG